MTKPDKLMPNTKTIFIFLLALAGILFLHGAVPFLATPTSGQAHWITGFSQSFVNESIFSIHANNFGAPSPAAMVFGLAGGYPAGLLIAAGLHPADAYSAMAALWLGLGFFGTWRIGLMFGLSVPVAALGGVLWMSMPVVWAHSGYSTLSLGIGLLPFYFWAGLRIFTRSTMSWGDAVHSTVLYITACLISVFMDGYSFMMFAVGASILAAYVFIRFSDLRRHLFVFAFPLHVVGFGLAYVLYAAYIGKPQFHPAPLDFFRGWGVDLTFLVIPTQGIHWIWDAFGWSVPRTDRTLFGDASVWATTFSIPVIVTGLVAWWGVIKQTKLASGFLLLALFGFYLALGPSLKIDSTRPEILQIQKPGQPSRLMPAEFAIAPTGNAWLSEAVPGFKSMRASYRWSALGVFGFWALLMLRLGRTEGRVSAWWGIALLVLLITANLPNLERKWNGDKAYREMFFRIDADLVSDMELTLQKGELVAFLPYRNDFLVNYLAPRLGIRTYNIGGDKNLIEARKSWPPTMRQFLLGQVDPGFVDRVLLLLARGEADVVVLPFIDMLWAAHAWPAPTKFKQDLLPVIEELIASGFVEVDERGYYAVVRLAPRFLSTLQSGEFGNV